MASRHHSNLFEQGPVTHLIPLPHDLELYIISHFLECSEVVYLERIIVTSTQRIERVTDIHAFLVDTKTPTMPKDCVAACNNRSHKSLYKFRPPYDITGTKLVVHTPHTVAFMSFSVWSPSVIIPEKLIGCDPLRNGLYLEICTHQLDDLVSLSLVDFDGDGQASLTFNPEMGTVIQEVRISPPSATMRTIKGKFCNILPKVEWEWSDIEEPAYIALFLSISGEITFLRKQAESDQWESTGVISKCEEWVTGRGLLTPCIAFGSPGEYRIAIEKVQTIIPLYAETAIKPLKIEYKWTDIVWASTVSRPRMEEHADTDLDDDSQETLSDGDERLDFDTMVS
jgi:hypothetical protein